MPVWLGEIIVSIVLIVLSVILYIIAGNFGRTLNPLDVGPAAFPRLALALTAGFCVIQIFLSLRTRKRFIQENKEAKKLVINSKLIMIFTCAVMVIYALLMPIAGFYRTTPVFIVLVMLLAGNRKWLQIALVPAGFNLFVYAVFHLLLGIRLP